MNLALWLQATARIHGERPAIGRNPRPANILITTGQLPGRGA